MGSLTLVAAVVEVDEVLLPVAGEGSRVNGVAVVLAGDVALASGEVERGDVVRTVAVLQLDGAGASGEGQELVAEADTHDGDGRGLHEAVEVVDGLLAVGGVTGAVGDEDTIEAVGDLVDGVVVGEDGHGGAAGDKAAEDVLLDTAVEETNVELGVGRLDDEGRLGADLLDEVHRAGVEERLVLVGIVLLADGDLGERRALLTEEGDDGAGVDARDGGHALARAPLVQALDGGPVAVLLSDVGNDDTGALDVRRFEVLEQVVLVTLVGRDAVVPDERLGEDQDLAAVRRVGHGLGVADERGREDGLTRDVDVGAEGLAVEDGTILDSVLATGEQGRESSEGHVHEGSARPRRPSGRRETTGCGTSARACLGPCYRRRRPACGHGGPGTPRTRASQRQG